MKSGVFLVDKPAGLSSAQVVAHLKHRLRLKKIGHAGTLDPAATGLLVSLVGAATRVARFAEVGTKIYCGSIRLGLVTETDDLQGVVLKTSSERPDFLEIEKAVSKLSGELEQVPPSVSAVKVAGVRSYRRVREGESVELSARRVRVDSFEVWPEDVDNIGYRVVCGKGTYIRSLARDLGESLGCGACIASLRREYSHPFSVAQAKEMEVIEENDLLPWTTILPDAQAIYLPQSEARRVQGGDKRVLEALSSSSEWRPQSGVQHGIYFNESSNYAGGVLVNCGGIWEIGVNIA